MYRVVYGLMLLLSHGLGVPFCVPPSDDLDFSQVVTFCDSSFCVCDDPYGRVHCRCPPEVEVEEVVVKSKGACSIPQDAMALTIDNCENVTVIREAFTELQHLKSVTFANVRQLSIIGGSFRWKGSGSSPLAVKFKNVTVPDVASFAFAGNIESIAFEDSYIGMIRAFAFTNIRFATAITIANSNVANVESQAFKKFSVSNFLIENSQFNLIPSRFVFEIEVENMFKINSTFIDVIRTAGFVLDSPKGTVVTGNRINTIGSEAFKIRTGSDVFVRDNKFTTIEREAFRGLFVDRQRGAKPFFRFLNNTVTNYEEKTFVYNRTSFQAEFSHVKIDELCSCKTLIQWRDMIHERRTTSEKNIEEDVEPFWCHLQHGEGDREFVSGKEYYQSNCTTLTKSIFFFVVIITGTAISLTLIILFIVCFFKRRRRWSLVPGCEKQKEVQLKGTGDAKIPGAKAIIVPDGRTYRETEFHVIVEKAEPLEVGYVPCKVERDRSRSQIPLK